MVNIAINGFGRIGRNVLRALYESGRNNHFNVVAINDVAKPEGIAHLLKYDTAHGRFGFDVTLENNTLNVAGDAIRLLAQPDINLLPWREIGVDIVLECTGKFDDRVSGQAHINAGAEKVLFSSPGSPDLDNTIIFGTNDDTLKAEHKLVSNGSCTTNCIVPVIQALDAAFGVESGTITTIHASMHDQQVIDAYHPDLRRTRAASQSIIPCLLYTSDAADE